MTSYSMPDRVLRLEDREFAMETFYVQIPEIHGELMLPGLRTIIDSI